MDNLEITANETEIQITQVIIVHWIGPPSLELDQKITENMTKIGLRYYGASYSHLTHERRLKFVKEKELPMG